MCLRWFLPHSFRLEGGAKQSYWLNKKKNRLLFYENSSIQNIFFAFLGNSRDRASLRLQFVFSGIGTIGIFPFYYFVQFVLEN